MFIIYVFFFLLGIDWLFELVDGFLGCSSGIGFVGCFFGILIMMLFVWKVKVNILIGFEYVIYLDLNM